MNALVIVHYHLRTGGVTRVIESASKCLTQQGIPHLILSSSPVTLRPSLPCIEIPELDYADAPSLISPEELLEKMYEITRKHFSDLTLVWHFHNHSLGKNQLVSELVSLMAQRKERLLLQIHDFAEDGRPRNYHKIRNNPYLYPRANQIHYLFLNSRDYKEMLKNGLPESQASILPNSCQLSHRNSSLPVTSPLVLYPVRAMRRKNLGELCLIATYASKDVTFAIGLSPEGSEWLDHYNHWESFSQKHQLAILFNVSDRISPAKETRPTFQDWQTHATHFITTSIAEGFGMAFIEPQFLGKPLIGRDLPQITQDLKDNGLSFPSLYTRLLVHESWIHLSDLELTLKTALESSRLAYGKGTTQQDFDHALTAMKLSGSYYDFGHLPESIQTAILEEALKRFNNKPDILVEVKGTRIPLKEWLLKAFQNIQTSPPSSALFPYTHNAYGKALASYITQIAQTELSELQYISPENILQTFLSPENFHFLRT